MEESKSQARVNEAPAAPMLTAEEENLCKLIATVLVETSLREAQKKGIFEIDLTRPDNF